MAAIHRSKVESSQDESANASGILTLMSVLEFTLRKPERLACHIGEVNETKVLGPKLGPRFGLF
jgi:hypothetical protein